MADGEATPKKQGLAQAWAPGQSGNPAGRPKGSRNKLGEQFIEDLYADWQANGVETLQRVREEKPDQYLKVVASILPKDLNVNINQMDDLTDDQLVQRIRSLDSAIRPFLDAQRASDADGRTGSETAH
ncbi:hypothetical protein HJB79_31315 [Rhizobium lentis]|uniref:DUF5681 domain-containing protein n=1 Tax=Rhizobium lentis TaxID=1138194 RepID=UPI001C82B91F|nr:DUF5681 domain-containing protein [Rhizobium lentis]MBX5143199.1 hypothetical protein [Rhizobium lentis]